MLLQQPIERTMYNDIAAPSAQRPLIVCGATQESMHKQPYRVKSQTVRVIICTSRHVTNTNT